MTTKQLRIATSPQSPIARVMALRDFRLLFAGAATSLLGDQFALIATPWLTLKLTGDPLVIGLVLALGGIPRAVFMLLGGAVTDLFPAPDPASPRTLMILGDDAFRRIACIAIACALNSGRPPEILHAALVRAQP